MKGDSSMPEWLKKINISKKEMVYLTLPLILLLIIFPTVIQADQVFITDFSDTLLTLNAEISVIHNPFSLWNNQWITGLPEYADPLSDRYYPLFYPVFILTQDIFIINLVLLIHLYIAYLFFFILSGIMTKNSELRMIFSLFYVFSGILLSRVFAGHALLVFALAWIPLLYYAFFKIVWDDELTVKNISIIAISLALIFFTGAVYYLFYSCVILAVFFVYYFLKKKISKGAIIAVFSAFTIGALILSIKAIPVVIVSNALGRIDIINPLGDGGSLENNLASIIFGTPIDQVFGFYESIVLIGIIPVLLVIIALVFGREDRTTPAFFAIIVAFIWADGGNTLLSFIHLLPGLTNFRVAGRILGALLPILLLLAIYGFDILNSRIKNGEPLIPDPRQKRNVAFGVGILILVKILELPFQSNISLEAGLSVIFIAIFIGLLYFNKATMRNLLVFFTGSCLIDAYIIFKDATRLSQETGIKILIIFALIIAVIAFFNREHLHIPSRKTNYACIFLILGLGIAIMGNVSYTQISNPKLDESPALAIVEKITSTNTDGHQIWVLENGWPIKHMDFTYWFIKNGIHPIRAYYPYFLNTMIKPAYTIGNVTYQTSDYIIDTAYLENGDQNLPDVSFKINNISIYKPDNVLPNAFVVRNNQMIPSKIEKFSADEVIVSGQFIAGDVAILKSSFYPGWNLNGQEASNIGNMVGAQIPSDTSNVTFRFDPIDVKVAALLSGIGIIILIIAVIKRRDIEKYLSETVKSHIQEKTRKQKK
ncbi:MAG: hypothetical protein ACYDDV_06160 [Methanoregula sp.]